MFAVCLNETREHIGNVKLTPIVFRHGTSDIGVVIGERGLWRKGLATEAIGLAVRFGFGELGLQKLGAGCYAEDEPCARAFERCGFKREGLLREQVVYGDRQHRTGVIRLGLLRSEASGG
jgi:RimJ/RimL family protein N-acetyltransferase